MSEQEIQKNLNDMLGMVLDGKILEAIDKYYHDDVVSQEGIDGAPSLGGKKAYLDNYKVFLEI
ncbi:MAG: hypothetical protein KDD23_09055 [Winogradskyella sp.]|nr:hypothetical protein [Winogradskyella sp.]